MTQHPNADLLRALADGKQVLVKFSDNGDEYPVLHCSEKVILSLVDPESAEQDHYWKFRIEQQTKEDSHG